MKKGTFVYALTELDEDLTIKYMPSSINTTTSNGNQKSNSLSKRIWPISACFGVLIIVCAFIILHSMQEKPSYSDSNTIHNNVIIGETEDSEEKEGLYEVYGSMYFNFSDSTSLLKIKPIRYYGTFYKSVSSTSKKHVIIEAEVKTDYYKKLHSGDTIYVSFPIEFARGHKQFSVSEADFVKAVTACDFLVLYTYTLGELYYYEKSENEVTILELDNLCTCYYYSQGIIPIVDSIVDYSVINNLFKNASLNIQHHFYNIQLKGYSIYQGASEAEAESIIEELVEKKIFGGDFNVDP